MYYSIVSNNNNLIEIKKSKFYGFAYIVKNTNDVTKILTELKKEHSLASHFCYAYILDKPIAEKYCDDGEPSGTAGLPIIKVLKLKKLTNILVVIVRYFGGIKLGAGGLTRAYVQTTSNLINNCELHEIENAITYKVYTDYYSKSKIENILRSNTNLNLINVYYDNGELPIIYIVKVENEKHINDLLKEFKVEKIIE